MQTPIIEIAQASPELVIEVQELLGKENTMSEMERVELACRIKGMSEAEKVLTAKMLPDDVLMNELSRRYFATRNMVQDVKCILKTEK